MTGKKQKRRKVRPQPPRWVWWDIDGCWFCDNHNACGGCKVMKDYVARQKEKIDKKNRSKFDFL